MDTKVVEHAVSDGALDIEAMLADLELSTTNEAAVVASTPVEEEIITADASAVAELGEDLAKMEIYEEAESDAGMNTDEAPAVVAVKPEAEKKPRASKKASGPKAPKMERDLNALPDDAFVVTVGGSSEKGGLILARPKQKKIAEKFDQTIAALHAGRKPSTYIIDLHAALRAKGGSASSKELIATLRAEGYTVGTAASQVGQIMQLFPLLKIADRVGNVLTLRSDSAFGVKIAAL